MVEKKDSARSTVILALVTLAVGVYALLFGLQTLFYFEAREWAIRTPFLNVTPQPLPSTVASPVQETNLSFFNMDFAAPWKGIASQKSGSPESEVDFKSGPIIIFFDPAGEQDILSNIRDGDPNVYTHYQDIFGADLFPGNYDVYAAVYGASPAAVSAFMPREQLTRIGTLLQWKLAFGNSGASAIYTVSANGMRGFQLGDPSRDRIVVVRLFDARRHQFRLLFTSKSGPGTFPQTDINCVLDSLKPAPRLQ